MNQRKEKAGAGWPPVCHCLATAEQCFGCDTTGEPRSNQPRSGASAVSPGRKAPGRVGEIIRAAERRHPLLLLRRRALRRRIGLRLRRSRLRCRARRRIQNVLHISRHHALHRRHRRLCSPAARAPATALRQGGRQLPVGKRSPPSLRPGHDGKRQACHGEVVVRLEQTWDNPQSGYGNCEGRSRGETLEILIAISFPNSDRAFEGAFPTVVWARLQIADCRLQIANCKL